MNKLPLLFTDFDGDVPFSAYRIYNLFDRLPIVLSRAIKITLFKKTIAYHPFSYPYLKSQLPSRTQFRKLSGRRKRIIAKQIERHLIEKGGYNDKSSE